MKKFLLLATGGTIASVDSGEGLIPDMDAGAILAKVPRAAELGQCDALHLLNLDSSNMQPEDWVTIAKAIIARCDDYDGIVVTHGTDTMAYTSAALSYMLRGVPVPVIMTGSQLPIGKENSDALRNLSDAFSAAADHRLKGVFLVFSGRIIRGCRACKISTNAFDAFRSINSADVGSVKADGSVYVDDSMLLPAVKRNFNPVASNKVFLVKLVSGFDPKVLHMAAMMDYKAVIIEGFGAGGVPITKRSILPELSMLVESGVVVAVTTQCIEGACDMSIYEVGRKAIEHGALSTGDITIEALVTKLMWIIGQTSDQGEIKRMVMTNYCGEQGGDVLIDG